MMKEREGGGKGRDTLLKSLGSKPQSKDTERPPLKGSPTGKKKGLTARDKSGEENEPTRGWSTGTSAGERLNPSQEGPHPANPQGVGDTKKGVKKIAQMGKSKKN